MREDAAGRGEQTGGNARIDYCETFLRFMRNIHVHLRAENQKIKSYLTVRGKNLEGCGRI